MDDQENIIVFKQFQSAIDANIAKTKLDAHGIPCFLTEENLSGLYPGHSFTPIQVRLHLFARDQEKARDVLADAHLTTDSDTLSCPNCESKNITRDFRKSERENLSLLFFGIFFPHKKVNRCLDCDFEF